MSKLKPFLPRRTKVGHGGTLDPQACGVLPVFVGEATRFIACQTDEDKEYRAEIIWGVATDTGDRTGRVVARTAAVVDRRQLIGVLAGCVGEMTQVPPMYSAVRQDGQRLYQLARRGVEVERRPRTVQIKALSLLSQDRDRAVVAVTCSRGTYIRTLCEEVGRRLGVAATMGFLVRTRSGVFRLNEAVPLPDLMGDVAGKCLPLDRLWPDLPCFILSERQYQRLKSGHWFSWRRPEQPAAGGWCRVYRPDRQFAGLAAVVTDSVPAKMVAVRMM
ncbi:MAG: tRNA pseudouridine(55) synthase TruB [Negativicutes bacterium]|nr:tRNA pseudouridine(55) synthase TruB [Negativicutes bacterium]